MSEIEFILFIFVFGLMTMSLVLARFIDKHERQNHQRAINTLEILEKQNLVIKDLQKRIINLEKIKNNDK